MSRISVFRNALSAGIRSSCAGSTEPNCDQGHPAADRVEPDCMDMCLDFPDRHVPARECCSVGAHVNPAVLEKMQGLYAHANRIYKRGSRI